MVNEKGHHGLNHDDLFVGGRWRVSYFIKTIRLVMAVSPAINL